MALFIFASLRHAIFVGSCDRGNDILAKALSFYSRCVHVSREYAAGVWVSRSFGATFEVNLEEYLLVKIPNM